MGRLRFRIQNRDTTSFSEWVNETIQHAGPQSTAAQIMTQLRREHPNAAISIERDVKPAIERAVMVRFKIDVTDKDGNGATLYSKSVPESESDELREQVESDGILKQFEKKTFTREVVNG